MTGTYIDSKSVGPNVIMEQARLRVVRDRFVDSIPAIHYQHNPPRTPFGSCEMVNIRYDMTDTGRIVSVVGGESEDVGLHDTIKLRGIEGGIDAD